MMFNLAESKHSNNFLSGLTGQITQPLSIEKWLKCQTKVSMAISIFSPRNVDQRTVFGIQSLESR